MMRNVILLGAVAMLGAGGARAAAAERGWQLRVGGASAQPTAGGGFESSIGFGLGLEYRASPRWGIEMGGISNEFEDELVIEVFDARLVVHQRLRSTTTLARLNLHLTPDRRADLYVGPVVGYARTGDLTVRLRGEVPGEPDIVGEGRLETRDELVWGAHLGLDVRLGESRSFLGGGVTFLKQPVTVRDAGFVESFDIDPLVFHLGYGYRF
jgi:hypothetical protein